MFARRTLAALAIAAALAGGTATVASADVPEGMTETAYQALQIRSEALNNQHGNARSPDWRNALAARSEGLNRYGRTLQASAPVAPTSASTSFAWDDFGIGMAAAFGLVLLTGGLAVAVRAGTRKRVSMPS